MRSFNGEPHVGNEMRVVVRRDRRESRKSVSSTSSISRCSTPTGQSSDIFLHGVDITERKRAKKRYGRARVLRAIFDASRDGILVEDDERIAYVNTAYARLSATRFDELKGTHISAVVFAPTGTHVGLREATRARARPRRPCKNKGSRKDGEALDLEASFSNLKGRGQSVFTTMVARHRRAQAREEALMQRREQVPSLDGASLAAYTLMTCAGSLRDELEVLRDARLHAKNCLRLNVKDLLTAVDLAADPIRFDELQGCKTLLTERWLRAKTGRSSRWKSRHDGLGRRVQSIARHQQRKQAESS